MGEKTAKRKKHNSTGLLVMDLLIAVVGILLDQLVKGKIRSTMQLREHFDVIPGILQIYYHENTGSAFGMLKGQTFFFILIAVVVLAGIGVLLYLLPNEKKYFLMNISLSLVVAGAIGNTIDRIVKASVTDFIYVVAIDFPIFNIADMYIVIATAIILILSLFVYKDEDFEFLNAVGKRRPVKASEDGKKSGTKGDTAGDKKAEENIAIDKAEEKKDGNSEATAAKPEE